jgi:TPR repeat protein
LGGATDYNTVIHCFRKSADLGCADAMYAIGICYENGLGVHKNLTEALSWFKKLLNN